MYRTDPKEIKFGFSLAVQNDKKLPLYIVSMNINRYIFILSSTFSRLAWKYQQTSSEESEMKVGKVWKRKLTGKSCCCCCVCLFFFIRFWIYFACMYLLLNDGRRKNTRKDVHFMFLFAFAMYLFLLVEEKKQRVICVEKLLFFFR